MSYELIIEHSNHADNPDVNIEDKRIFISTSDCLQDAKMTIIERLTEEYPINRSVIDHHDKDCFFCITNEGVKIKPGVDMGINFDMDGFIEYLSESFLYYNTAFPYSITIEKIYKENQKEELHYKIFGLKNKQLNKFIKDFIEDDQG